MVTLLDCPSRVPVPTCVLLFLLHPLPRFWFGVDTLGGNAQPNVDVTLRYALLNILRHILFSSLRGLGSPSADHTGPTPCQNCVLSSAVLNLWISAFARSDWSYVDNISFVVEHLLQDVP